ncbi:MAG: hypothetical protein EOO54_03535 [Haliea sp.]|jgi:hypothetical protein|nr:MAG: hypothetical protein EOO54_03535 [Haliea sp.]
MQEKSSNASARRGTQSQEFQSCVICAWNNLPFCFTPAQAKGEWVFVDTITSRNYTVAQPVPAETRLSPEVDSGIPGYEAVLVVSALEMRSGCGF